VTGLPFTVRETAAMGSSSSGYGQKNRAKRFESPGIHKPSWLQGRNHADFAGFPSLEQELL
jgi:hypothetical protein